MRLTLAGCPLEVRPDAALSAHEREALEKLASTHASAAPSGLPPFCLHIVEEPPWPAADLARYPDGGPAAVDAFEGELRVTHRRFAATLDPVALEGRLFRPGERSAAVETTLRVALAARLPALGALPLHAAGLILDGVGHVFFGPSGAGKTTLSSVAPGPVLSDELVAVAVHPPELRSTGFWGEMGEGREAAPSAAPLRSLVELARGDRFRLERLDPGTALRRLLGVLLIPPLPALWGDAIGLVGLLARRTPVYRMEWRRGVLPWDDLRQALITA